MTDKEVIIHGVNVSGCKHYEKHTFYDCNETCEDNGAIVCTNCKDNPNCDFKQLQRKTAECEKYKQALNDIEGICRQLLDDEYIRSVAESLIDIINKAKDGSDVNL